MKRVWIVRLPSTLIATLALSWNAAAAEQVKTIAGISCQTPPLERCGAECDHLLTSDAGNVYEPKSGRRFFLDYPCDLKQNEKITLILNLHGAGSSANWQRHYFPATDYKEKYRLVIATPTAATQGFIAPIPVPFRVWDSRADDRFLENVVTYVFDKFGRENIRSFWLVGHSQGGITANRLACASFFKYKIDGWLSLSGGRIGAVTPSRKFGSPRSESSGDTAREFGEALLPTCNISYIFVSGELEINALPKTSPWAEKYRCGDRIRQPDAVDEAPGYVHTETITDDDEYATLPHVADIFVFPRCKRGKLVADVFRLNRDHSDGLGPEVTDAIIRLIMSAPGGKARDRG